MKVTEAKKILTLTKEEKEVIDELYQIFDDDNSLDVHAVWDILTDIYLGKNDLAEDYGYKIEFVD